MEPGGAQGGLWRRKAANRRTLPAPLARAEHAGSSGCARVSPEAGLPLARQAVMPQSVTAARKGAVATG